MTTERIQKAISRRPFGWSNTSIRIKRVFDASRAAKKRGGLRKIRVK